MTKKRTKYDPDAHPLTVYELARAGLDNTAIAASLEINTSTFALWRTKKPAIKNALQRARQLAAGPATLRSYIQDQLPQHLLPLWSDLVHARDNPDPQGIIDSLFEHHGEHVRQQVFFYALVSSAYNASTACRMVGITKKRLDIWRTDPEFQELMLEVHFHKQNFFEHALIGRVMVGDTAAILHCAKTQLRDRGYGERLETATADEGRDVDAEAAALDALPLDQRRALMAAHRTLEGAAVPSVKPTG